MLKRRRCAGEGRGLKGFAAAAAFINITEKVGGHVHRYWSERLIGSILMLLATRAAAECLTALSIFLKQDSHY
jgi:hypothetical protein